MTDFGEPAKTSHISKTVLSIVKVWWGPIGAYHELPFRTPYTIVGERHEASGCLFVEGSPIDILTRYNLI